ncbi:MAG: hypothetical protein WAU65_01315 [Candidatus Nanoarchaeia archaeon]
MGKEFDRIKSYEKRYYARAEAREAVKRKRATDKGSRGVMILMIFIGIFILVLSPTIIEKIVGGVIALLGLMFIVWSIRYYRNR